MILVAGAGLAGLSAAYHLQGREVRLIEREDRPGGLARTERTGGYDFDYGGHLLHLRGDDVRALVQELIGPKLTLHQRRSAIFSSGVSTPYPYQVNTHGLPPAVIRDCLVGFVQALRAADRGAPAPDNFHDWVLAAFGPGFAEHFFFPFNQKFFKTDLHDLTPEWAQWSIPRPELEDVVEGALGVAAGRFGYNAEFFYPEGGIEELPRALAGRLERPVETGTSLVELLISERRARLGTGEEVRYDRLISTIPLDRLLLMAQDAPAELKEAGRGLKVLSVLCLNLGVAAPLTTDQHWIYVPEPRFRYHRVGLYSNFRRTAPGRSSLYLELTLPGPVTDLVDAGVVGLMDGALADLKGMPLWRGGKKKIETIMSMTIEHGYVIYDRHRARWLPRILAWLADRGVLLAGRYARWEYATMEDALRQGRQAAEAARGGGGR